MKKLCIIFLSLTIFFSCSIDPYKERKIAVIKIINTIGDSEILQKVKFEEFTPIKVVYTKEVIDSIDNKIKRLNDLDIKTIELLKSESRSYKSIRDYDLERINLFHSYETPFNRYNEEIKKYKNLIKINDMAIKNYSDPYLDYYKKYKEIFISYGDTAAIVYNTIYVIENKKIGIKTRTKKVFSFVGFESIPINQEVNIKWFIEKIDNEYKEAIKK